MLRLIRPALYLSLFIALTGLAASAQVGTSRITGTVTDPTGAVVGGATVTAKNEAIGLAQTQTTTDAGLYAFTSLPAGNYTITVTGISASLTRTTTLTLQVN